MTSDLKKCFIEFLGTFFLVFTILGCTLLPIKGFIAPIAIGLILMALMYSGGHISGGNYNPLITLSIFLSGKMGSKKMLLYIIFQVFGAAYAALMISLLSPVFAALPETQFNTAGVFFGELVFTTLFIYVFLFTILSNKIKNNSFYGMAIGSTLTGCTAIANGICLATFNPFVLLAFLILRIATVKVFIITIIAQIIAMIIACLLYNLFNINNVEEVEVIGIDEFIKK